MAKVFGFKQEDVDRISSLLKAFEQGQLGPAPPSTKARSRSAVETYVGQATEEIASITANDDGDVIVASGVVKLHRHNEQDDGDEELLNLEVEIDCYNLSEAPIAQNAFVSIIREPYSGKYFATSSNSGFIKVVRLTQALTPCASATASILTYDQNQQADPYDPYCSCPQWKDTGTTIPVWDALNRGWATNTRLVVTFIPMLLDGEGSSQQAVGRWVVLEAAREIVRFKLLENLPRNGSAAAEIQQWNGSSFAGTGCTITVYDTLLTVFGPAPGTQSNQGGVGAAGYAWKFHDTGNYEVIFMERFALFVNATTTSAFVTGNYGCQANATPDYSWRGIHPTSSPIVVILPPAYSNICNCFPTGTPVTAVYDEKIDAYRVVEISTALQVCDVTNCEEGQEDPNPDCTFTRVGSLKFGDGLSVTFPTPCTGVVQAETGVEVCTVALPESQGQSEVLACVAEKVDRIIFDGCIGIEAELDDACKPTARLTFNPLQVCDEQESICTPTTKLVFSGDVEVTPAGVDEQCDTVTVDVDSRITVCDDDGDPYDCFEAKRINFVGCLDVHNYDAGNESVDVKIEGGTGQQETITMVSSISCDGDGKILGYCTKTLTFNACGLLTSVGQEDCSHDCYAGGMSMLGVSWE